MELVRGNRNPPALTKHVHFARIPVLLPRGEGVVFRHRTRARIAQLVEQLALNQTVGGSNPSARTETGKSKSSSHHPTGRPVG